MLFYHFIYSKYSISTKIHSFERPRSASNDILVSLFGMLLRLPVVDCLMFSIDATCFSLMVKGREKSQGAKSDDQVECLIKKEDFYQEKQ